LVKKIDALRVGLGECGEKILAKGGGGKRETREGGILLG